MGKGHKLLPEKIINLQIEIIKSPKAQNTMQGIIGLLVEFMKGSDLQSLFREWQMQTEEDNSPLTNSNQDFR